MDWYACTPGAFITYPRGYGLCEALSKLLRCPEASQVPIAIVTDESNIQPISALLGEQLPEGMFKKYSLEEGDDLDSTLSTGEGLVIFDSAYLVERLGLAERLVRGVSCKVAIMVGWHDCSVMTKLSKALETYKAFRLGDIDNRKVLYLDSPLLDGTSSPTDSTPLPGTLCLRDGGDRGDGLKGAVCSYLAKGGLISSCNRLSIMPGVKGKELVCEWVSRLCREKGNEEKELQVLFHTKGEGDYKRCRQTIIELDWMDMVYQQLREGSLPIQEH